MPYNFDFKYLNDIKIIEVNPKGWVTPLTVEYGITEDTRYNMLSYFWRVKGTTHTFVIPVIRMDFLSSGDYQKHFNTALTNFREDYLNWINNPNHLELSWVKEYKQQYKNFIII